MKLLPKLSSDGATRTRVISIRAGASTYEAIVGSRLLETIGARAAKLFRGERCAVVSDTTTATLFSRTTLESLTNAGFTPTLVTVPSGENSKSLEQTGRVCDAMQGAGLDRTSFVVALGGGVIGDLAGFAAAIYHRGIPCIQAPTTLLAQVDSAIGGKTGVNTSAGKNSLGAVHQPSLVLADLDTLRELPEREFRQGFAEMVKHGIIADAKIFEELNGDCDLAALIARNIEIKASIVSRDERDLSGERAILNFGHTVGHAIERVAGYGKLRHGEAISLGMIAACEISVRRAGLPEDERAQIIETLSALGLPIALPADFPREQILHAMKSDKKFERGEIRFVVTPRLGSARLTSDITLRDIEEAVDRL